MKNTMLKKVLCIIMAVMLLLPAFSVLTLAADTDNGQIKKITSQPTSERPTVETNDADASYQWYYATSGKITDENASTEILLPIPVVLGSKPEYTDGIGWTPALINEGLGGAVGFYFEIEMEAGEELVITMEQYRSVNILLLDVESFYEIECEVEQIDDLTICISDIKENCRVVLVAEFINEPVIINAEIPSRNKLFDAVEGQTTNTLTAYELNKSYACEVTFSDGSEEISSVISYVPMIKKQPTMVDPSVGVSFEEYATYKWVETVYDYVEINLDNAQIFDAEELFGEEGASSYDSEKGWTPLTTGDIDDVANYYFMITLKEGDVVRLNSELEADKIMLTNYNSTIIFTPDENNEFKVTADGLYALVTLNGNGESVKAQVYQVTSNEVIEGQTANALTEYEVNKSYACVVTWTYGETVVDQQSHQVNMIYTIVEQPTPLKPTIEVSFKDNVEKYEWLVAEIFDYDITDENSTPYANATYDSENGWIGVLTSMGYSYFTVDLKAGEILTVTSSIELEYTDVLLFGTTGNVILGEAKENGEIVFQITKSDKYTLISNPTFDDITILASVCSITLLDETVEGQSTSTLTDFEVGEVYFAKVTYKDGAELISNALLMEYEITSQPTAQKPTIETNKNEDVKKYSWYRIFLSDYYRLAPNDGIVDGQSLVEDIYSGYYLDGKWMSDSGYINIGVTAIDGDIVKVTFIDGFDGYACLYYGEDFAEQNDGSYIYTVSDSDQGYVDLEICNDNNEPIEAIVEIVRDGESYPVFDSFDFTNKKYYPNDVDSGYYDGEKWISTKVYSEQELDIEFYFEDCYTVKITLNDGFVGTAFLLTTDLSEDNEYAELEIVDGVITYVADGYVNQFKIIIYSDHEFTAEITLANDDIELEVVDETLYDNEKMMYFCDYIYGGSYEDGAWISDEEDTINFDVYLYEDSIITFKPSDNFDGNIELYDYQEEESIQLNAENGEYTYKVTKDGYFEVYIYFDEQYTVEILVQTKEIQLVEGQTEKTFKPSERGSYYADVEFKDGTVLTSNIFEINSLVIFNTNGGTPLDILAVATLTEISKTEREGFVLEGWYLDKELIEKPELPLDISGIVNLYAKWIKCDHKSSTNKPTCTEDVECTVCKADYKATGHSYNSSYTAENGKHFYECTDCGAKQGENDHSFGEWTVTKYAERNTQGEEKRACTVCGHIESRVIEPLADLSNGAIVGIIIGSGALLALIAVATFILIKRKRSK